jgi:hypothetical protein
MSIEYSRGSYSQLRKQGTKAVNIPEEFKEIAIVTLLRVSKLEQETCNTY